MPVSIPCHHAHVMEPQQPLEDRVARLERQNRLLVAACLAAVTLPIALGAGQAGRQVPPPTGGQLGGFTLPKDAGKLMSRDLVEALKLKNEVVPIVKTKLLCLVDKEGRVRATLSTGEQNHPVLALLDSGGSVRAEWRLDSLGALYQAWGGPSEKPVVRLGVVQEPLIRTGQVRNQTLLELNGLTTHISASNLDRPQDGGVSIFSFAGRNMLELSGTNGYRATMGTDMRPVTTPEANRYSAILDLVGGSAGPTTKLSADVRTAVVDLRYRDTKLRATMEAGSGGGMFTGRTAIGPPVNKHQKFESRLLESSARSAHIQTVAPSDD